MFDSHPLVSSYSFLREPSDAGLGYRCAVAETIRLVSTKSPGQGEGCKWVAFHSKGHGQK